MSEPTFMDLVLAGAIVEPEEDIDDYVDAWHNSPPSVQVQLHEWLGMSWLEYSLWAEKPSVLRAIITARHQNGDLVEMLRAAEGSHALAARGVPQAEVAAVKKWLQDTGRL
jgi:hypothetical protein